MHIGAHSFLEAVVGRANVYLPDELERRVKAAAIPISEVCQRALLAAVEAAENHGRRFDEAIRTQLRLGREAGESWVASAAPEQLLALVRNPQLEQIPAEALPDDLYSLTGEQSLAWEAGFSVVARAAASAVVIADRVVDAPAQDADPGVANAESASREQPAERVDEPESEPGLGDDAGCRIGSTLDGAPVSFDPHAAVRAGKSPLFAILGQGDLRARLTLSVAQDAASRGAAVVLLDVSGQLCARARGLGKNVRVVRPQMPTVPGFEELTRGAVGLGGLWEMLSGLSAGGGPGGLFGAGTATLPPPGHVTVLDVAADGGLASALAAAQAAHLLGQFAARADHPRLVHIDLPSTINVPAPLVAQLHRVTRAARDRNTALGLSADSAQVVTDLSGIGSLLSTVFAFATSNPVEADRLRDLLGAAAPILVNPPGTVASADEQTWVVMRDLDGRLGQVRLDAW
jgi:post-segregation antitoxin (ccd killing protein)